MADLKSIIAENLYELRCASGLTQLGFAEKINYSDKAVSKWERAESVPDIYTLKQIADFYGVGVDYLLTKEHPQSAQPEAIGKKSRRIRITVSLISVVGVWLIATVYFAIHMIFMSGAALPGWMSFIYAVAAASVVALVFNSLWGRRRQNWIYISLVVWSVILSLHLTLLTVIGLNAWMLYLLGIPGEIIIALTAVLSYKGKPKKEEDL